MADDKKPEPTPPTVVGGPGAEPDPQPKLVAVKYGGRELQVPEDVATVWQEREREYEQRMSKQGAELGEYRKRWQQVEPLLKQPETPKEPDINTLWFENPQAAYQKIVTDVETKIEAKYRQDQAYRSFWDGFYRKHDDLREDDWVARTVFQEHFEDLAGLTPDNAQEKLGELTREKILKLTRKVKSSDDSRPRPTLLEPASGDRPPRVAREEDEGPNSISELIAQRRAARRAAQAKGS